MSHARHPAFVVDRPNQSMKVGVVALDGSNPTTVAHGLKTAVGAVLTLEGDTAPGDNTSEVTYKINGTNLEIYAWKATSGTDPTLVASTGTENVSYVIFGE
jgi:hypothetical protein